MLPPHNDISLTNHCYQLISFPNAKINLGLNITAKREDGYHNLESCFYPVPWQDMLEILPSEQSKFSSSGIDIPGSAGNNLCLQAYHLLQQKFNLPSVHIHLHKIIPIGAGLGGGSADAAFTLRMLIQLYELKLSDTELENYAAQLGSDCSFFVRNQPIFATGTGTNFSSINIDLAGRHIVIIKPDVHIATAEAYAGITPSIPETSVKEIIEINPIAEWKSLLKNDFEDGIFSSYPHIRSIKEELYKQGAVYASMSGSGSAVYGIFESEPKMDNFKNSTYYKGTL